MQSPLLGAKARKIYISIHRSCHCDDNCLVGRLETKRKVYLISLSRLKASLALAVCLAGCDDESGIISAILRNSISQPYSDCPSV